MLGKLIEKKLSYFHQIWVLYRISYLYHKSFIFSWTLFKICFMHK